MQVAQMPASDPDEVVVAAVKASPAPARCVRRARGRRRQAANSLQIESRSLRASRPFSRRARGVGSSRVRPPTTVAPARAASALAFRSACLTRPRRGLHIQGRSDRRTAAWAAERADALAVGCEIATPEEEHRARPLRFWWSSEPRKCRAIVISGRCKPRASSCPARSAAGSATPQRAASSSSSTFVAYLRERVTAYPGLTGRRLLRELRERGYEGGYTAVTDALRELRPARLPAFEVRGLVCAVKRRRFPVGARPTRQPLQLEATGAVMEVTKWLKPSDSVSRKTVTARVCRP
jgi:hypothetical protein